MKKLLLVCVLLLSGMTGCGFLDAGETYIPVYVPVACTPTPPAPPIDQDNSNPVDQDN